MVLVGVKGVLDLVDDSRHVDGCRMKVLVEFWGSLLIWFGCGVIGLDVDEEEKWYLAAWEASYILIPAAATYLPGLRRGQRNLFSQTPQRLNFLSRNLEIQTNSRAFPKGSATRGSFVIPLRASMYNPADPLSTFPRPARF
jgi:hypothetical protein